VRFLTSDAAQQAVSDLRGRVGNASLAPNLGKFSVGKDNELRTERDFSRLPQQIDIGSPPSLLAALISG